MPFLTRDFAVFLGLVAFLLCGITVTGTSNWQWGGQAASVIETTELSEVEYEAELPQTNEEDARESRLKAISAKVGDFLSSNDMAIVEPEPEVVTTVDAGAEMVDEPKIGEVIICSEYARSNPAWNTQGLKFDVVEGALLIYREKTVLAAPVSYEASTTLSLAPVVERDVVLQLPHRQFSSGQNNCLATDIIGVAVDGSLIRNGDYTAYGVFGSETLVGYALDGFAIYGMANFETDICGGSDISGEYRYYLNKERKGVLGCFSSTPVSI